MVRILRITYMEQTQDTDPFIEKLLSDRDAFNAYIYSTWSEALVELERRQQDPLLTDKAHALIPNGVPEVMAGKKNLILFRHIATPNYEVARFLACADALADRANPLILEYTKDKFTNRNDWKFSLAKMSFHKGHSKDNEMIVENKTIIDINDNNFKPIHSISTHWGQQLVDFHHELFETQYPMFKDSTFDLSDWLHELGPSAKDYYTAFLALFVRDGILFENFMVDGKEEIFTKEVILPAIIAIEKATGKRPLIVPLEPTNIEGDRFWLSYPYTHKEVIDRKVSDKG